MEPELVISNKALKLWQRFAQFIEEEFKIFEKLKYTKTMEEENSSTREILDTQKLAMFGKRCRNPSIFEKCDDLPLNPRINRLHI